MRYFIELLFFISFVHLCRSQESICSSLENDIDYKGSDRKYIYILSKSHEINNFFLVSYTLNDAKTVKGNKNYINLPS